MYIKKDNNGDDLLIPFLTFQRRWLSPGPGTTASLATLAKD